MIERQSERRLPNRWLHHFLLSVESEMGRHTLQMILRQAGLQRYVEQLPPPDTQAEVFASEFSKLQRSIREYYGRGARGPLNRIGRRTWSGLLHDAGLYWKAQLFLSGVFSKAARRRKALDYLINCMRLPGGQVDAPSTGEEWFFLDLASDVTLGEMDGADPICWMTLGMIQEALAWAGGEECDVEEVACRAMGAETCRFRIRFT